MRCGLTCKAYLGPWIMERKVRGLVLQVMVLLARGLVGGTEEHNKGRHLQNAETMCLCWNLIGTGRTLRFIT